jgi:hypothetical protein
MHSVQVPFGVGDGKYAEERSMESMNEQFGTVFQRLRSILQKFERDLVVKSDEDGDYYLNTRALDKQKRPVFFGAVQARKNYVSYHLMPVYAYPELLEGISADLRKRMQGKSCFNFSKVDERLFEELAELTGRGSERFRQAQLM